MLEKKNLDKFTTNISKGNFKKLKKEYNKIFEHKLAADITREGEKVIITFNVITTKVKSKNIGDEKVNMEKIIISKSLERFTNKMRYQLEFDNFNEFKNFFEDVSSADLEKMGINKQEWEDIINEISEKIEIGKEKEEIVLNLNNYTKMKMIDKNRIKEIEKDFIKNYDLSKNIDDGKFPPIL